MEQKTYQECIELCGIKKPHLMLGNGFSISLFPDIFNYAQLKEAAKQKGLLPLFDLFKTNDYEFVMRKILEAKEVVSLIENEDSEIIQRLSTKYNELSETLIETIAKSHPETPSEISENQYSSCRNFLSNYDKVYTFNYDLILYWVYMHFKDNIFAGELKCDDGFRSATDDIDSIVWEIGAEHTQQLYYIHGALHIYSNSHTIEKCVWRNSQQKIIDQVRANLSNGKLPLFVAEGSKAHKKERIHSNGYLARSFASLKSIGNNLIIFGHSIRDEDDHVFDLIINRNKSLKNIFVGIYGDFDNDANKKILAKISNWENEERNKPEKKRKNIYYFQSADVNVWHA